MTPIHSYSMTARERTVFFATAGFLFAAFAFQLVYHAVRTSATNDERPHIFAGYRYWQCGDFSVNPEHPPLVKLLATVPLTGMDLIGPSWECGSKVTTYRKQWTAGTSFLTDNGLERVVVPSRLMMNAGVKCFTCWLRRYSSSRSHLRQR
jgi:hypothetical protein